ncbi:hypothetical protein [Cyclobacterium sp.]|uniref:hypothetical protein n=1 Tax=Cyclobacterium sp. TaxID=1966343 RepID=UPI001990AFB2|nr:hypothetical protein [Cyclobacterium sp.]MBD3627610.1 hypothetical protein [Cyclobacterium sp.]
MNLFDYTGQIYLEESAALNTEVCIADYFDVETFPALPDLTAGTTNSDYVDLAAATFTMKTGKKFHKFSATLERNSLTTTLEGPRGAKSFMNMLTIARSGADKELVGFLRANRNRKLVVAFKFLGATQYCFLGYNELPAEVDSGGIEVGAEISGEKVTNFVVRSIFYPPMYIDEVPLTEAV